MCQSGNAAQTCLIDPDGESGPLTPSAQQVVEQSKEVALRDRFGHQRLREGMYTPDEIDRKWSEAIEADSAKWRENQK